MSAARQGFTLLELLLVIAIIGIIGGAFAWWMVGSIRRAEVREAAYQLVGDLRQSRTRAQKTGFSQSVKVQNGTENYELSADEGLSSARRVEKGVRVHVIGNPGSGAIVTYQPPHGTLMATGTTWEVRSPAFPNVPSLYVKVVGITGKVMVSASED